MVLIRREEDNICYILDRCLTKPELVSKLEQFKAEYESLGYVAFFQDESVKTMLIVFKPGTDTFLTFMCYYKQVPLRKNFFFYR